MNDEEQFSPVAICFDKNVYDKDRSMRCANQSKMTCKTEPRPLQITSGHEIKIRLLLVFPDSKSFHVPPQAKCVKKHKETLVVIKHIKGRNGKRRTRSRPAIIRKYF